ncbi:MAG: hypothetical protein WBM50_28155 [Acidimicrobiales bacterium]
MILVLLWTLFVLSVVSLVVAMLFLGVGLLQAFDGFDTQTRLRWRRGLPKFVVLVVGLAICAPMFAWGASYVHASGRCDAIGGEFRTWAGGAGWECIMPEDFGPLPADQNQRIDITGIDN